MISPVLLATTPSPYASQFIFEAVSEAVQEVAEAAVLAISRNLETFPNIHVKGFLPKIGMDFMHKATPIATPTIPNPSSVALWKLWDLS